MALNTPSQTYTELTAAILPKRRKKIADAISNKNAYWMKMKEKGRIRTESGGTQIEERLIYDSYAVQNYVGSQQWITDGKPTITASQWAWVQKFLPVTATGKEIRIAMADEDTAIRFVKERIEVAHKSIANHMAVEIFGDGLTTSAIYGLKTLVSDGGGGIVGGLDSAIATNWQNQSVHQDIAAFGVNQVASDLRYLWRACLHADGKPDIILANSDVFEAVESSMVPQQRYMDEKLANSSFEQVGFKGVPLVEDYNTNFLSLNNTGAPVNPRAYMLKYDTMYIFQHKDAKWEREETRTPHNSDTIIIPFLAMLNQVCTDRRKNGVYYTS